MSKWTKKQKKMIPGIDEITIPYGWEPIWPGELLGESPKYIQYNYYYKSADINNWNNYTPDKDEVREKSPDIYHTFIKPKTPENKGNNEILAAPPLKYTTIMDIKVGDIFASKYDSLPVIITKNYLGRYFISGSDGLQSYWNCQGLSLSEMLHFLNKNKYIFTFNINNQVKKSLELAAKMVNNG